MTTKSSREKSVSRNQDFENSLVHSESLPRLPERIGLALINTSSMKLLSGLLVRMVDSLKHVLPVQAMRKNSHIWKMMWELRLRPERVIVLYLISSDDEKYLQRNLRHQIYQIRNQILLFHIMKQYKARLIMRISKTNQIQWKTKILRKYLRKNWKIQVLTWMALSTKTIQLTKHQSLWLSSRRTILSSS